MALFRKSLPRLPVAIVTLIFGSASRAPAEFRPPVMVSAEMKKAGAFQVGFDFFENLTLAYEEEGEIILETRGNDLLDRVSLGEGRDPGVAFNSQGAWIVFSSFPSPAASERKIFLVARTASQWSARQAFSDSAGNDRFPQLALSNGRLPVVAWERDTANGGSHVWFRRDKRVSLDLGQGTRPALALDNLGRAHVFFLRDGDIFYVREDSSSRPGVFTPPLNITQTPALEESAPRVAIADGRNLYLCFSRGGNVYLASNRAGKFTEPQVLEQGGAANPSLAISSTGAMAIAFEKEGDVYSTLGTTFFLPQPALALKTPETESAPSVVVDSAANVFIGFHRGDELYYLTNAGPPVARFEASPAKGEAPLRVEFTDTSTGHATGWSWDFGDGTVSHDRSASHLYSKSGRYVASLRVAGPGGESPLIYRQVILVEDPSNEMRIAPVSAFPGQKGLHVPVLATNKDPAQGFTVAAVYDPALLLIHSVEFESTNISDLKPELFAVNISDDPEEPYFTAGVLLDITTPFDRRVIPPGKNHRIANILMDVRPNAPPGTRTVIELKNELGRPPLSNIFTVGGYSVLPILGDGGGVNIRRLPFPPPRFFIRGDADGNGAVNITDSILTLNYLFAGRGALDCADAADVTDDGRLDVTDAVFTLNFLFRAGNYPPPPYPEQGMDPTDDGLPPCLLR